MYCSNLRARLASLAASMSDLTVVCFLESDEALLEEFSTFSGIGPPRRRLGYRAGRLNGVNEMTRPSAKDGDSDRPGSPLIDTGRRTIGAVTSNNFNRWVCLSHSAKVSASRSDSRSMKIPRSKSQSIVPSWGGDMGPPRTLLKKRLAARVLRV